MNKDVRLIVRAAEVYPDHLSQLNAAEQKRAEAFRLFVSKMFRSIDNEEILRARSDFRIKSREETKALRRANKDGQIVWEATESLKGAPSKLSEEDVSELVNAERKLIKLTFPNLDAQGVEGEIGVVLKFIGIEPQVAK